MSDKTFLTTGKRLDHETESVIETFAVQEWCSGQLLDNYASDARDALRSRIRQLVEEARSNAVADYLADKDFIVAPRGSLPKEAFNVEGIER